MIGLASRPCPLSPPTSSPETIKDSGERRNFSTGAVRDVAEGKGRFDLLPYRAILIAAQQMERGAAKYAARNWEKGIPLGEYFNSLQRHLNKWWLGYTDEPHLSAVVWNALCMAETYLRIQLGLLPKELDNRPDIGKATLEEQGYDVSVVKEKAD